MTSKKLNELIRDAEHESELSNAFKSNARAQRKPWWLFFLVLTPICLAIGWGAMMLNAVSTSLSLTELEGEYSDLLVILSEDLSTQHRQKGSLPDEIRGLTAGDMPVIYKKINVTDYTLSIVTKAGTLTLVHEGNQDKILLEKKQ